MKKFAKPTLFVLTGLVLGIVATYIYIFWGWQFFFGPPPNTVGDPKGMTAAQAHQYFVNYQGNNPNSPRGRFRTVVNGRSESMVGMYLDKDKLFQKLEDAACKRVPKIELTGYYVVLAKENKWQHRLLFMGVYEEGNEQHLMLPLNDTDVSAIYDWIEPCPDTCPEESAGSSLWDRQKWLTPPNTFTDSGTCE